jgi:hypothetical protein
MATFTGIPGRSTRLRRQRLLSLAGGRRLMLWAILIVGVGVVHVGQSAEKVDTSKTARPQAPPAPAAWTNDLSPIAPADWNYDRAAHLLERAGFGGTPEEIEKLAAMTPAQAVDYLVDFESIDNSTLPAYEPSNTYPNGHRYSENFAGGGRRARGTGKILGVNPMREGKLPGQPAVTEWFTLWYTEIHEMDRGGQWWAERMLLTPRPLEEKLALFWHNHFATSQEKVRRYEHMLKQIQTFRTHSAGNFRSMLVAVAQDPAMLDWLDNRANVKGKPNENFAREIMELFTMGEGQGYTESDIRQLARAFTGWTLTPDPTVEQKAEFKDDPKQHDDGEKNFLGERGNFNGYDAIDIILKQPATPRFISTKLYRYFVRDDVSPEVQAQLAKTLVDAKYEFKPLLKTMFLSRDFYSQPSTGTQIKSPVQLLISTYRKLGLKEFPSIPDFTTTTDKLGQHLFYPPNVAGWAGGQTWINPATLLIRGNFAYALLFPDTKSFIPPDKVVIDEYRRIPFMFPDYDLVCHIWNPETQRMEPVSREKYEEFLALVDSGTNGVVPDQADAAAESKPSAPASQPSTAAMVAGKKPKSMLGQMVSGGPGRELFNLAVGVWEGYIETYNNRVKPIPRTAAKLEFVPMAKAANATTVEEAVDYFCRRFLRTDLQAQRRNAVISFLQQELGSTTLDYDNQALEHALRRVVHLILSSPEYQLG